MNEKDEYKIDKEQLIQQIKINSDMLVLHIDALTYKCDEIFYINYKPSSITQINKVLKDAEFVTSMVEIIYKIKVTLSLLSDGMWEIVGHNRDNPKIFIKNNLEFFKELRKYHHLARFDLAELFTYLDFLFGTIYEPKYNQKITKDDKDDIIELIPYLQSVFTLDGLIDKIKIDEE